MVCDGHATPDLEPERPHVTTPSPGEQIESWPVPRLTHPRATSRTPQTSDPVPRRLRARHICVVVELKKRDSKIAATRWGRPSTSRCGCRRSPPARRHRRAAHNRRMVRACPVVRLVPESRYHGSSSDDCTADNGSLCAAAPRRAGARAENPSSIHTTPSASGTSGARCCSRRRSPRSIRVRRCWS